MTYQVRFWMLVLALGVGTWAMRSVPILLHGRVRQPAWLERLLRHVPVAALTAMVVPSALYIHSSTVYTLAPARIVAGAVALAVAIRTRNVVITLVVGMAALWLAQWVIGLL